MTRADLCICIAAACIALAALRWHWRIPAEPLEFTPRPSCSVFPEASGPPGRSRWETYEEQFKLSDRGEIWGDRSRNTHSW